MSYRIIDIPSQAAALFSNPLSLSLSLLLALLLSLHVDYSDEWQFDGVDTWNYYWHDNSCNIRHIYADFLRQNAVVVFLVQRLAVNNIYDEKLIICFPHIALNYIILRQMFMQYSDVSFISISWSRNINPEDRIFSTVSDVARSSIQNGSVRFS